MANNRQWRCRCDCGAEVIVLERDLQSGRVTACPACTERREAETREKETSKGKGAADCGTGLG